MSSKEITTPRKALIELLHQFDHVLESLDDLVPNFELAIIPTESTSEEAQMSEEERLELAKDIQSYVVMSSFLLEHPFISVLKQIRDESQLTDTDTPLLALKHQIRVGQIYRHYKGEHYKVLCVGKDSNNPVVEYVMYQSLSNLKAIQEDPNTPPEIWSLPIFEFAKVVHVNGARLFRFKLT